MATKHALLIAVCCVVFLSCVPTVEAQLDLSALAPIIKQLPPKTIFQFMESFLAKDNFTLLNQLEDLIIAAVPLITYDVPQQYLQQLLLPWSFNKLPGLLKNQDVRDVLKIMLTELNNHTFVPDPTFLSLGQEGRIDYATTKILSELDYFGMLQKILKIDSIKAAVPLITYDAPQQYLQQLLLPWSFNHLPGLLNNQDVLAVLKILLTELNNHTFVPDPTFLSLGQDERIDYATTKILSELDYLGMLQKILKIKSVRDIVPYKTATKPLNEKCYNDTMLFIDRLLAGDEWALDMFDAVGKPTTGIRRGVLYFLGTFDQCQAIHTTVPAGASMGPYHTTSDINVQGKYCRATFDPPASLINDIAGDHVNQTYGIPLQVAFGLCLPDTCLAEDIEGLLNLGFLGSWFNLSVAHAECEEDQGFDTNTNAHIILAILGIILLLVMVSSALELLLVDQESSQQKPEGLYHMNGTATFENSAYENDLPTTDVPKATTNGDVATIDTEGNAKEQAHKDHLYKHMLNMSVDSDLTDADALKDKPDTQSLRIKMIRCFSAFTNIRAAMSTETKMDDIPCMYGIRTLSMFWIIMGNAYIYVALPISSVPVPVNLMDSFDMMKRFSFEAVFSTTLATDTFFVISGCLVAYWFLLREESNTHKINVKTWLKFYAGKLYKMTIPYMIILWAFVLLYKYVGDGPLWPKSLKMAESCWSTWWTHLLYVNNVVGVDGVVADDQCMPWSWYIAVNMQFYLISPVLLSFTAFSKSMGMVLIGILTVAGMIATGLKEAEYGGDIMTSRTDGGAYWNNVFITPWCRVGAYCIGLLLGCVLQKWYNKRLNKALVGALWLIAVCLGMTIVYIQYTRYTDGAIPWTRTQQAVYEALSRPVWALCVSWMVYACSTQSGGPIGEFLSWKAFVPLSRVTFIVYLVHPIIIAIIVLTRRSLVFLEDYVMAYYFMGHVVLSYAAAIALSLLIDLPFRNIKRILTGKSLDTPF